MNNGKDFFVIKRKLLMRMVKNVLVAEKKRLLSSQLNILIEMVMSIEKLLAIFINGLFGIIFPKKDSQSYA